MGSPKDEKSNEKAKTRTIIPSVAEKRCLMDACRAACSKSPTLDNLSAIIETIREFLLPLVRWLDTDLSETHPFLNIHVKNGEVLKGVRGMMVYDGWGQGELPSFALLRSGKWKVLVGDEHRTADSTELAGLIYHDLECLASKKFADKFKSVLCEDKAVLHGIIKHDKMVDLLNECFKTLDKRLKEKEDMLVAMRKRIDVLADLGSSIDPLLSQGDEITLPTFHILNEHERGTTNYAQSYLCVEALDPYFEAIRRQGVQSKDSRYKPDQCSRRFRSLDDLVSYLQYLAQSIQEAERRGHVTADSLLSNHTERLPLTPEEIVILRELIKSVYWV
jgi:hypothetical protein